MIDENEAREAASRKIRDPLLAADPLFAPWTDATVGDPIIVHTVTGEPSYWLVPVILQTRAAGFVRVNRNGTVAAVGAYYRDVSRIAASPRLVTHIAARAAADAAAKYIDAARGDTFAPPVYVHDGPPGREAWMVEVSRQGQPTRWVFVTPGGVYERPAGAQRDSAVE